MVSDPLLVAAVLAKVFDDLGIRYLVGGSLASSVYGVPRATQDVDLVAELRLESVDAIHQRLDYLARWAPLLDVAQLLARARKQS